jgi:hypothetical protein
MTRRSSFLLFAALALLVCFAYFNGTAVHGQQKASPAATASKDNEDLFKEKILLLEVMSSDTNGGSNSVVIENTRTTKIGSREFVIGEGYATDDEDSGEAWYDGMTVGVPCENIIRLQSMTPERFKEYMKMWKNHANEQ